MQHCKTILRQNQNVSGDGKTEGSWLHEHILSPFDNTLITNLQDNTTPSWTSVRQKILR